MQLSKWVLLILVSLTLIQCREDDELEGVLGCYSNSVPLPIGTSCATFVNNDPNICRVESFGTYSLTTAAKEKMPFYCEDVDDLVTFRNGVGEEMIFRLSAKQLFETLTVYADDTCETDRSKLVGLCFQIQVAVVEMESSSSGRVIRLGLLTGPDNQDPVLGEVADYIQIVQKFAGGQFVSVFTAIAEKRTLTKDKLEEEVFVSDFTLLDQSFSDVTYMDFGDPQPFTQYYYQVEKGIVGFKDIDGTEWVLVE